MSRKGVQTERFIAAIGRFDELNGRDPRQESVDGVEQPKELVYAHRMTHELEAFSTDPSEVVQLAVRCQHIQRWLIARSTFPEGRDGYRRWRTALAGLHAEIATEILRDVGYDSTTIGRVQALLRKERLKSDPEVQCLEDVACLVFLKYYLTGFAVQHDEEKLIGIIRKTWRKMSRAGQIAALKLSLTPELQTLVSRSIGSQ